MGTKSVWNRLVAPLLLSLLCVQAAASDRLIPFLPAPGEANGTAVIVCPGGSYYWFSRKVEGTEVAQKLADEGFAAYVLRYRHSGTRYFLFRGMALPQNHYPDPQRDLLDAIRSLRESYERIIVMGFSAGGHLVLSAGELFGRDGLSLGEPARDGDRPDCIVAVYPVVTMSREDIVHDRSRHALLGSRYADAAMRDSLSLERHVPEDMPPVFLTNCKDDPTVDWRNSVAMDSALTVRGIPHAYRLYDTGGHGYGTSREENPSESADWLTNDFLPLWRSGFQPQL